MSFVVAHDICIQCPLSTKDVAGVHVGVLRCTVCHCFISVKAMVHGECPKFATVEEMLKFKREKEMVNG